MSRNKDGDSRIVTLTDKKVIIKMDRLTEALPVEEAMQLRVLVRRLVDHDIAQNRTS